LKHGRIKGEDGEKKKKNSRNVDDIIQTTPMTLSWEMRTYFPNPIHKELKLNVIDITK